MASYTGSKNTSPLTTQHSSLISPSCVRRTKRHWLALAVAAAGLGSLFQVGSAHANTYYWDTTDGSATWGTNTNWSTDPSLDTSVAGAAPGAADTAYFNRTSSQTTIDLGAGQSILNLYFDTAAASAFTIGSGAVNSQTLTLANGGAITMNSTVVKNQVFNAALTLGADATTQAYTFTNNSTTNALSFAGNITGGSTGTPGTKTLTVTGSGNTSIGGIIANGGATAVALTKSGNGTLSLSGVNTFTGATTISAGTLQIAGAGQLGTGTYAGSITDNGALVYSSSAAQTLSGVISGSGSLTKDTANSTLILSNSGNSFTGNITVNQGTLQTGGGGSLGNAGTIGRQITVGPGGTLTFATSDTFGNWTATPAVTLNIGGTVTNNNGGNITALGVVNFNGGTLAATGGYSNTAYVLQNGYNVTVTGSTPSTITTGSVNVALLGAVTFNVADVTGDANADLIVTAPLSNHPNSSTGSLIKTGAGTMLLSNANTYTGGTTISAGTLQLSGSGTLGNTSGSLTVNTGGTLNLNGTNQTVGNLSGTGGTITNTNSTGVTLFIGNGNTGGGTYAGSINSGTGTIALDKVGTGTITLSGTNSVAGLQVNSATAGGMLELSGTLTSTGGFNYIANGVSGNNNGIANDFGTLQLDSGSLFTVNGSPGDVFLIARTTGTGVLTQNGGTFNYNPTTNLNLDVSYQGTGTYNMNGGTLTLNGKTLNLDGNTGSGTFNLNGGLVQAVNITASGGTTTFNLNGGTLQASGTAANLLTGVTYAYVKSGGAIVDTNGFNATIAQALLDGTGGGGLTKSGGTGTLTLTGNSTYTGGTTISAGTLLIGGTGVLGSGTYSGALTNNAAFAYNSSANQTLGGIISGNGTLTQSGSGSLTLTGSNTYTGNTAINGGVLNAGVAENANVSGPFGKQAANAVGTIIFGGGILQYSAVNQFDYSGRFSTAANQVIGIDTNGQNVTFGTALTSSGGTLTKLGTGTLTLNTAGNSIGNLNVNGGALSLAGGTLTVTNSWSNGFQVGNGTGTNGTFNLSGGTLGVVALTIGTNGGTGFFNQTGGTINATGFFSTGLNATTGSGIYRMGGGTFSLAGGLSLAETTGGTCAIYQTGGTITAGNTDGIYLGRSTGGKGIIALTGGTFTDNAVDLRVGSGHSGELDVGGTGSVIVGATNAAFALRVEGENGGTGIVNQGGGTVTVQPGSTNGVWLYGGGTSAIYNLNGGTLSAAKILAAGSNAPQFNFGGGTLTLNGAMTVNTATGFTTNINAGGATINTNGFNGTWNPALLAGATNQVTGISGLVGGSGYTSEPTLTLTGTGTGATAIALISGGAVAGIIVTNPGTGYTSAPTVGFSGGGGSGASATALNTTVAGGLTKLGAGTLTLSGSNTYTGGTAINGGVLSLGLNQNGVSSGPMGASGPVTFGGGTLQFSASNAYDYSPRIASGSSSGAVAIDTNGQTVTFGTALTGSQSGGLTLNDTNATRGALILTAANAYTGLTTVTSGALVLSNTAGGAAIPGNLAINGSSSNVWATANNQLSSNAIVSSVNAVGVASFTLLNTTQTIAGLSSTGGGLMVANTTKSSSTPSPASNGAGTLILTGSGSYLDAGWVWDNWDPATGYNGTVALVVNMGAGGTQTLSGDIRYGGGTTVNAGTLKLGASGTAGFTSGAVTINTGGTLDLSGVSQTTGSLSGTGGTITNSTAGVVNLVIGSGNTGGGTFAGSITAGTGTISLYKFGTGTITLSGTNTVNGIQVDSSAVGGTLELSGTLTSAATTYNYIANGGTHNGTANDFGTLQLDSGSLFTVTANGTDNFVIGRDSGTGIINQNGGTFNFNPGVTYNVLYVSANGTGTYNLNGGTLNLNGNTLNLNIAGGTGTFNLNGGLLQTVNVTASAGTTTFNLNGGTLQASGTAPNLLTGIGNAFVRSGGAIVDTNGFNATIAQALLHDATLGTTPDGGLTKSGGTGTLTLTSTASSFTGNLLISAGTLVANANNNVANATTSALGNPQTAGRTITVASGAALNFTAANVLGNGNSSPLVALIDNGTITNTSGGVNPIGSLTLNGGTLTATTAGTANTYQTYVLTNTITAIGTTPSVMSTTATGYNGFHLGANTTTANITFNVDPNSTGASLLVSAPLTWGSGGTTGGSLTKTGPGTLTLSGANTYTGGTTVNAGTLQMNSANTSAASVTVNTGGTLALNIGDALGATTGTNVPTITSGGTITNITSASRVSLINGLTMTGGTLTGTGTGDAGGAYSLSGTVAATSDASGVAATMGGTGSISLQNQNVNNGAITFNVTSGPATPSSDLNVTANLINFTGLTEGITKTGTGIMTLSGANTYTGGTTISGGVLQIGGAGKMGSGNYTAAITNNAALIMNTSANQILSGIISGTGSLTQSGSGTLTLNNTGSNFTGNITVNQGVLQTGGGTNVLGNPNTVGRQITINSGGTLTFGNSDTLGTWAATPAVTLNINGTVNNNGGDITALGAVNFNGGTLAAIGGYSNTAYVLSNGYNVTVTGSTPATITTGSVNVALRGAVTFSVADLTSNLIVAAPLSNHPDTTAGGLIKTGSGTMQLSGANTYTLGTTVNGGKLLVSGTGSINTSSGITINGAGAGFVQTSSVASTPAITLTQGSVDGTGTVGNVTVADLAANVVAGGNGGSGTLTVTGNLTFSGAGTINLINSNLLNNVPNLSVGTLTLNAGTVTLNAGGAWSLGNNKLIGYTAANGLNLNTNLVLGTVTGTTPRQSITGLAVNGNEIDLVMVGNVPAWSGAASSSWSTATLGGPTNWQLNLAPYGDTNLLPNDDMVFGDTAGTLAVANFTVNIDSGDVSPHSVTFTNNANNYTINGPNGIAAGKLNLTGSGTVTLATSNSYTGDTTIANGKLILTGSLSSASNVILGGGTTSGILQLGSGSTGLNQTVASLTSTGSGNAVVGGAAAVSTLTVVPATATTYGGVLGGAGANQNNLALVMAGTGTLILTANSTYTGGTTINAGTLQFNGAGALYDNGNNAGSIVVNSGGTLAFARNDTFGQANTTTPVTVTVNAGGLVTSNGWYTTLPTLLLNGGELRANGGLVAGFPAYQLRSVTIGGSSASLITAPSGTNSIISIGDFLNDNVTFNVADATGNASVDLTVSAPLQNGYGGNNGLIKTGPGTMQLSAANTFTGDTVISGGTLLIGSATALQNSTLNYNNQGGTLSFGTQTAATLGGLKGSQNLALANTAAAAVTLSVGSNAQNTTYSGALSSGSLTKLGGGALMLTGNSTLLGLQANGGKIDLTGSLAITGSGNLLYVGNGGTNFGIGNGTGSLVIDTNASLTVTGTYGDNMVIGRDSGSGTLTQNAGSSFNYNPSNQGTLYIAASNNAATNSVYNMNGGTLTMNSKNLVVGFGSNAAATGTLNIATGATIANVATLYVGQGQGIATVNQAGGSITVGNTLPVQLGSNVSSSTNAQSTYNLNGGTLTAPGIVKGSTGTGSTATFNFNGGTLQANAASATFMTGLTTANVRSGGAIIDTNGYNLTIGQALLHSTIGGDNALDGGLTKNGIGTLTLTGSNTYTGLTTVNTGELDLNTTGGQAIAANLTVNGGTGKLLQANQINTAANLVVSGGKFDLQGFTQSLTNVQLTGGTIAGSGGSVLTSANAYDVQSGLISANLAGGVALNKSTSGTVTLAGTSNTYSGGTAITGGKLIVSGSLATGSSLSVDASGDANATAVLSYLNANLGTVTNSGTLNFTAATGTVTLGGVTNSGTLSFNTTGTVTLSALYGSGTITGVSPLVITAVDPSATLNFTAPTSLSVSSGTISGQISGATTSLVKNGGATDVLVLSGSNTYGGGTTIGGGTLQIGTGGSTGSLGTNTGAISDNGVLAFNRSDAVTLPNQISGTGGIAQLGTGTLNLTNGGNTYAGGTTLNSGMLSVSSLGATAGASDSLGTLSTSNTNLVLGGGTLNYTGTPDVTTPRTFSLVSGAVTLTSTGGALNFIPVDANNDAIGKPTGATTLTLAGDGTTANTLGLKLSDTGAAAVSLVKAGSGTWILAAGIDSIVESPGFWSGTTTISSGTLQLGATEALPSLTTFKESHGSGTNGNVLLASGATLDLHGYGNTINGLGDAGTVDAAHPGLITNLQANSTALLAVGDNNQTTTFSGLIQNGATVSNGVVALAKIGSGTLTLNGSNTYSGGTTIQNGTVVLGTAGALPNGTALVLSPTTNTGGNNPTLDLGGQNLSLSALTGTSAASATPRLNASIAVEGFAKLNHFGNSYSSNVFELLDGNGNPMLPTGLLVGQGVSGANLPSETTITSISGFYVQLSGNGYSNYSVNGNNQYLTTVNFGTVSNAGTSNDPIIGNSGATPSTLTVDTSTGPSSYAGGIQDVLGSGTSTVALALTGTHSLTLSGSNTFTGGTTIGTGSTLIIGDGVTNGSRIAGNITNNSVLTINTPDTWTYGGNISRTGSLTTTGSGVLSLSGANTYSGATTIGTGSTLQLGSGGATGSLAPGSAITNNGTLAFNRNDTITQGTDFAAVIGGSGNVIQAGAGVLVLSGINTYTGTTTITGGTLKVTGTLANNQADHIILGTSISAPTSFSGDTPAIVQTLARNASYANIGSSINTDRQTTASLLAGTIVNGNSDNSGNAVNLGMAWRTPTTGESFLFSDVVRLTGMTFNSTTHQTDDFVLAMSYDPNQTGAGSPLFLGTFVGNGWVSAVSQNIITADMLQEDPTTGEYAGRYNYSWQTFLDNHTGATLAQDLGAYGIDLNGYTVWAVLDHNSDFAVIPEPTSLGLLGLGALGLLGRKNRKRRV